MAEKLKPPLPQSHASTLRDDAARHLSRSPHPYHKQNSELPFASERFSLAGPQNKIFQPAGCSGDEEQASQTTLLEGHRESGNSDSGTEADDEHFLKGLPAPRLRPPKGMRGVDGLSSGTSTPLLSPATVDEAAYGRLGSLIRRGMSPDAMNETGMRKAVETFRHNRRIEIVRRVAESSILGFVGVILCLNPEVRELVSLWKKGNNPDIFVANQANCFRINLPNPHHIIPYCCVPVAVIAPHKSTTTLGSTTSHSNSSIFRSRPSSLPSYDYHICGCATLCAKPNRVSTRLNFIIFFTSEGTDTSSRGAWWL